MAIVQNDKRKVLDYQDLNEHVDTYTTYANMCVQKQCVCIGKADLLIHVHQSLWPFQTIIFKE